MKSSLYLGTIYAYFSIILRSILIHIYLMGLFVVSAGPVGNLSTNNPPPRGKQYRRPCSIIFYMLQTLLYIPAIIVFNAPILFMIWVVGRRLWDGADEKWSDFRFIPMGILALEIQITFYEVFRQNVWHLFPYIKPSKFPKKLWRGIVWVWKKLKAPFNRAKNGLTYYLQILYQYLKVCLIAIYEVIAAGVKAIASFLYSLTKGVLQALWEALKWLFDIVVIKILGSIASAYFGIFRIVFRGLKPLGIVGELLFTLYGLAWLLWPLGLAYFI